MLILGAMCPVICKAGPARFTSAKIYIVTPANDATGEFVDPPTPEYIRTHPSIAITMDDYAIEFTQSLHLEKAKHNLSAKERAKHLVAIIDLYERVQPAPPAAPRILTLYCNRKYAYTEAGDYIVLTALITSTLKLPL